MILELYIFLIYLDFTYAFGKLAEIWTLIASACNLCCRDNYHYRYFCAQLGTPMPIPHLDLVLAARENAEPELLLCRLDAGSCNSLVISVLRSKNLILFARRQDSAGSGGGGDTLVSCTPCVCSAA